MSEDRVQVPWVVGTEVAAPPFTAPPEPSVSDRVRRKRADIEATIALLERLRQSGTKSRRGSAAWLAKIDAEIDLQRRRLGWLDQAAASGPRALNARREEVEAELGPDGVACLVTGLPRESILDQRLLFGLCELALIRLVMGE